MNYLIAAVTGALLGFVAPKLIRKIEISLISALLLGVFSGLIGFQHIRMAGVVPKDVFGVILSSAMGVVLTFLNVKQYYNSKFPKVTILARLFLGLFMLSSGIMMLKANPQPGQSLPGMGSGQLADWLQAVINSGFLWQWIFIFKIIFGILVLIPRTTTVGILGALSYYVNLTIFTVSIANVWLFLSLPAITVTIYLIYAHWNNYKHILIKQE